MVGKRTIGAYRKILAIPRVRFAAPELDASEFIARASLIAVVTGSVALEAAILGKPVITFGDCPLTCSLTRSLPAAWTCAGYPSRSLPC